MRGLPTTLLESGDSFYELLGRMSPQNLPTLSGGAEASAPQTQAPGGTTILAVQTADGVLMVGDRRATAGNVIASHSIEKVHPADDFSLIGVAGTAGLALELIRLFQLELEHYEKIAGRTLSLPGKANRLSAMLRDRLNMALGGLAVVPLFAGAQAGTDPEAPERPGTIFSYDVTGGKYSETRFHAIGSGSAYARGALKKLWRPGLDVEAAAGVAVRALLDAADDDSATGGPDLARGIAPQVFHVSGQGVTELPADSVLSLAESAVAQAREESVR